MIREKETITRRIIVLFDGLLISLAYALSYYIRLHLDKFPLFRLVSPSETPQEASGSFSEHLIFLFLNLGIQKRNFNC